MNTPSLYLCGVVTLVLLTTANATIMLPSSCIFPLIALLVNTLMQIGSPHSISSLAMFSVIHSSGHAADGHGMHKERKKQAREVVKVEKKKTLPCNTRLFILSHFVISHPYTSI